MQQSAASMKPLQQQQQQTISQTVDLQRTASTNTLLAASAGVRPPVATHLSVHPNVEQQQQQAKQLIAPAAAASVATPTNISSKGATASIEPQRTNVQPLSSTASQLYNDFRNAEQMRKELDENARQVEAQQKLVRYIFNYVFERCNGILGVYGKLFIQC